MGRRSPWGRSPAARCRAPTPRRSSTRPTTCGSTSRPTCPDRPDQLDGRGRRAGDRDRAHPRTGDPAGRRPRLRPDDASSPSPRGTSPSVRSTRPSCTRWSPCTWPMRKRASPTGSMPSREDRDRDPSAGAALPARIAIRQPSGRAATRTARTGGSIRTRRFRRPPTVDGARAWRMYSATLEVCAVHDGGRSQRRRRPWRRDRHGHRAVPDGARRGLAAGRDHVLGLRQLRSRSSSRRSARPSRACRHGLDIGRRDLVGRRVRGGFDHPRPVRLGHASMSPSGWARASAADVDAACRAAVRQAMDATRREPKVCIVLTEAFVVDPQLTLDAMARALPDGVVMRRRNVGPTRLRHGLARPTSSATTGWPPTGWRSSCSRARSPTRSRSAPAGGRSARAGP